MKFRGAPVLQARMAAAAAERLGAVVEAANAPRKAVKAMGLPWPTKQNAEPLQFPSNITELSHGEVRNLMSYYTAFHGYASSRLGVWLGKQAVLSRTLQSRRQVLFLKYKPEKKTSEWSEAIQGRISKHPEIRRMEAMLSEADAMVALLDKLSWTYKTFADTASREITARANEIEIGGRSGQRTFRDREERVRKRHRSAE